MNYNKFERARIIGARALQISLGAPTLVETDEEMEPIDVAKKELEKNLMPVTVSRQTTEKNHFFGSIN